MIRALKSESAIGEARLASDGSVVVQLQQRIQLELDGRTIKREGLWIPLTILDSVEETWQRQNGSGNWKVLASRVVRHSQDIDAQWLARQTRASSSWSQEDQRYFQRSLDCMRGIGYNCGGR